MLQQTELHQKPTPQQTGRIHVIGAGPVGLLLTSILQSADGPPVRLYEKRREYTRTRMVSIAPYLVSNSTEAYQADSVDGESVAAIFDEAELEAALAFRQTMKPELLGLLKEWSLGFCPLNTIEQTLSSLIDSHGDSNVERAAGIVLAEDALAMLEPGDTLIDCSGSKSVMRDYLVPNFGSNGETEGQNTQRFRMEYALVVTFLYGQRYACNEYCKYYKNVENPTYKFIPAVHRTYYDGAISHVTGIISISPELYQAMPRKFDGEWLRGNFPDVAESMDRFIDKVKMETHGEIIGDLSIVSIPLNLYRARNATSLRCRDVDDHPLAGKSVFLGGDSAVGSPYFQSISLGFESVMYLANWIGQRSTSIEETMASYESLMYRQWMRVYMRTRMIKHNKDLLQLVDDKMELLSKLHVY